MRMLQITKDETRKWGGFGLPDVVRQYDVVIVDGYVVKNRLGKPGGTIGGALFIWNECEEFPDSDPSVCNGEGKGG